MPLKAKSTTGRVWPEQVSGVCLIAMSAAAAEDGGEREEARGESRHHSKARPRGTQPARSHAKRLAAEVGRYGTGSGSGVGGNSMGRTCAAKLEMHFRPPSATQHGER